MRIQEDEEKTFSMSKKIFSWIESVLGTRKTEVLNEAYFSLSPITTAPTEHYSNVLDWALTHRKSKKIYNIAITGPYGSGKSSILQTFQETCNKKFIFLNISLATFKEEIPMQSEGRANGEELLRLIELSILQQIFYQEDERKIPDSRFKRITSYSDRAISISAFACFLVALSLYFIVKPEQLSELIRISFDKQTESILHYFAIGICSIGALYILKKLIRILTKVRLSKLSIQDAKFEIGEEISKSILNSHVDEILYFFEVTPYNVVVIEDLDRFQQTEIFTKLREINLLLNNSKKIKKEIVFIYAVRDEMFLDRDRTKFFDLIIPVIPVVNASNSKEKLLEKARNGKFILSEDLIEDVSFFLNDMRLLHNIVNEFQVYKNNLSASLNQDKLFSIICYKNLYPSDFAELSNYSGDLYKAISQKKKYVTAEIETIENKISEFKREIKVIESNRLQNNDELRMLYLYRYVEHLPNFNSFVVNGNVITLSQAISEGTFDQIASDNSQYRIHGNGYTQRIPIKFNEIERQINAKSSYADRKDQIEKSIDGTIETLKQKIEVLNQDRRSVLTARLKDIVNRDDVNVKIDDQSKSQLITLLLKSGYIDEDYLDYISFFYEGSIAKADHQYLLNIKTQIVTDFEHRLSKVKNLIERINPLDFGTPFILNLDLVTYILSNE